MKTNVNPQSDKREREKKKEYLDTFQVGTVHNILCETPAFTSEYYKMQATQFLYETSNHKNYTNNSGLPQFHMRSVPWRRNLNLALLEERACKRKTKHCSVSVIKMPRFRCFFSKYLLFYRLR